MMHDAVNDIGTALMNLRRAFAKHGLFPPDGLEWYDQREKDRVELFMRQNLHPNSYTYSGDGRRRASLVGFTFEF